MTTSQTKYRVCFRSRDGKVYYLRREYGDLIAAQSAADDYNIGEPTIPHWVEPSSVSNNDRSVSQNSLRIEKENFIQFIQ
jgi:hypothetical protein